MNEKILDEDHRPDFLLTLHFEKGVEPQRIFLAASRSVDALNRMDGLLLSGFPPAIRPVLVLEQVVTDADIKALLVDQSMENEEEALLKVRRPDFLGRAKWEFRHGERTLSVGIADKEWLARFQQGEVDVRPMDALHVLLKTRTSYDAQGKIVSEEREIVSVLGVKRMKKI